MTRINVNGWLLTDDDSSQYLKPLSECKFDCIEARALPGDKFAVVRTVIDLDLFPREEMEPIIESYHETVDEVFGIYGEKEAAQIIAECLFEQLPVDAMDESVISFTEPDAFEVVQQMIHN